MIEPWHYSENPKIYNNQTLYEYIDGAADLYIEFAFKRLIMREMTLKNSSIVIEMYEMSNSTSAWGIYTSLKKSRYGLDPKGIEFEVKRVAADTQIECVLPVSVRDK